MNNILKISILFILLSTSACVSGLNINQKRKLSAAKFEYPEMYEEEKNVTSAILFGILPGGGSFYTEHYGSGIISFLLWPVSVLWDPINGANGAQEINYYATTRNINRAKDRELKELGLKYVSEKISEKDFNIQKMQINNKYDLNNLL
ncbi:MAG: hypothetical protein ACJAZX_000764 [Rickettsiales bacterium]|jgi:hypothetical protein